MSEPDVLIIGAGAAGLMCAIEAGKRGRRVVMLDHADRIGKKILISGGGRCNFTNRHATAENFISTNPHFCKSALARFTPQQLTTLIENHHIPYFEKTRGQLFCERSSKEIVQMLTAECRVAEVDVRLQTTVIDIKKTDRFSIETNRGAFAAASLVIATGGLSFPQLGASDFGHRIAQQFGLAVVPPQPALVPFLWNEDDAHRFSSLSGISMEIEVAYGGKRFREAMLFTHRGISGPAILQISSYWQEGEPVTIDLLPDVDILEVLTARKRDKDRSQLHTLLSLYLPRRFADVWCERFASSRPILSYADAALADIARQLHAWVILPAGTEGYRKAEVTRGGVDTRELSSQTFETKKVPGLYFIGEVLDVTGELGGFNFQWAWASGVAAGRVV